LHLAHKPLCALISLGAETLLGVTLFDIFPESLSACPWWAVALAAATGCALFFFVSKYVHHVCPACAASHFDASTFWLGLIMAHVGGGFFYLAAHAVLGEMLKHGKQLVVTSFSAGVVLIAILNLGLRMLVG